MVKFIGWASWIFGIPVSFLGIAVNLDNWKATVIFILAAAFWVLKIWMSYRNHVQKYREKDIEIQGRLHELNKQKNST